MKKIAISVGDLNGIGIELILKNHDKVKEKCRPIYCINKDMLDICAKKLNVKMPQDMQLEEINYSLNFDIKEGQVSKDSGAYSFKSFQRAIEMVDEKKADSILTMPIHKKAWQIADVPYKGHTDYLSYVYNKKAIMMLGCEKMYVALFSDHIELKKVPSVIKYKPLKDFLLDFYNSTKAKGVAVLGLNPHAGDDGVLGNEDSIIQNAIDDANEYLGQDIFEGAIVPDIAFTKRNREKYKYFIAMYHDQGLIPLKTLYFDESINVTLGLPIKRASVDHGCAFDIAYNNEIKKSSLSYLNAIEYLEAL